ncbi:hypothetical protein KFL_000140210 [Klebsormidium nitens]|uniref:Uncharacterized protein n=1 Tax=Klebsormidium nitens TaxID=105231 RepID=A0A1Y1HLG6_KLENI|nr:hypothetical protein KFL_000140210 [Klebsormidium nitens]|eukprot:GAQ78502.1 hypothetical protein KFL_000140210 [Klebsormidium nitens]
MFNKLSGWGGSAAADQEAPVSQEIDQAVQTESETTPTKHMMESGKHKHRKHHHREVDGTQEEGVLAQEATVIRERPMVQGAEQSLHYLDGVPIDTSLPQETTTTYVQQEVMTPSPRAERTLAVYEPPRAEAPAASTTLVTVKSISAEERDRQIHEENLRRAQLQEEQMKVEAAAFMEKQKRDTIAFMQKEEAKAQAKYEKEMTNAAYREAQVQKKAADMCAEAAAARKKVEIRAQQKLEMKRAKAKTLAEENLATAKVRGTAIQKGDVRAELTQSWTRKFSNKLKM